MPKKSTCPPTSSAEGDFVGRRPKLQRRRVLYIITKSVWAGAAKYIYDLATHLPKDKFVITVAAGGRNKFAQRIIELGIPYFEIKNFQRTINPLKDWLAFFEIFGLIRRLKPEIIHVNSSKAGLLAGLASWLYKLTTSDVVNIFTVHGWAFLEDRPQWQIVLIKFLSKLTALFYDKIICVSEYDRKIAIENQIAPANKFITIHNGIDLKTISFLTRSEAQQKLLGKTSPLVIGTIAEWTKNKGLFFLLEASTKIKGIDFDLVLIGSGENPDKEKIYSFIKKHSLKNIYLYEWIAQAASYLKVFDIFILPSVKEGLPYTILEAMAAGLPIIATQVGGLPEMIDEHINGLLVEPKNSQALAEKIIYLLEHPSIAQNLAKKARQKLAKEFTLEKMVQQTEKVYSSL